MPEYRVDISRLASDKIERTPSGGARIPAALTRVGVFTYRNADGTVRRELRPAEEVFKADSLVTLRDAPVVVGHPAMVDSTNWSKLAVGHVSEPARQEGNLVRSKVTVQKADALAEIDAGNLQELSCGYTCEFDPTPGTYDGQPYDGVHRSITYNHVGLGPKGWGRAGSEVALRLDGGSATFIELAQDVPRAQKMKIRFDGKEYERGSDDHVNALEAKLDGTHAELATASTARDTAQARADAAEVTIKDLQTKLDAATSPEALTKAVNARVALVVNAAKVLGAKATFDGKTDREIMTEVVAVTHKEIKLDGKSDDYVSALFDVAVQSGIRADSISQFPDVLASVYDAADTEEEDTEEEEETPRAKRPLTFSKESK